MGAPSSPSLHRTWSPGMFPNQESASFGLGAHPDDTPCDVPPSKHPSIRSSDVCFPNSRLRLPVLAGSRCVHETCASCELDGFWDPSVVRGRRCARTPVPPLWRVAFVPDSRLCDWIGDVVHRDSRCNRPLASLSPLPLRFSWDHVSRFRVGPPGQEPPRSSPPLPRDQQRLPRSGMPSVDRGHFAWAKLALHLGAGVHRAASGILPHPHARRLDQRGPGGETAVGAPTTSVSHRATPVSPLAPPPSLISRG
jgi:hypothetical protein